MWSVRINGYKENFYLYAFIVLSGSIEPDNHNMVIEKFEKCSDKWV